MLGVDGADAAGSARAVSADQSSRRLPAQPLFDYRRTISAPPKRPPPSMDWTCLGWYHSHPDHPARPSEFDREHAWPWYSYVIVSVANGEPQDMTSWQLEDDRSHFQPEEMASSANGVPPAAAAHEERRRSG